MKMILNQEVKLTHRRVNRDTKTRVSKTPAGWCFEKRPIGQPAGQFKKAYFLKFAHSTIHPKSKLQCLTPRYATHEGNRSVKFMIG